MDEVWYEICYQFPNFSGRNRWSFEIDNKFNSSPYWVCNYVSMLGLKLKYISDKAPGMVNVKCKTIPTW